MKSATKIMLSTLTLAIVSAFASVAAAQEATPAPEIDNFVSQKTRAEVRAELAQAIAQNRIIRNDADAQRLAFADFVSTKSRVQVAAETREAVRPGLIPRNDFDYGRVAPTAEQLRLIAEAGERAVAVQVAAR